MSIRRMKCILHSIKDSRELRNSRTYSSNFLRISLTSSLSMSVIVEVLRRIVNGAMCSNTTRAQHKSVLTATPKETKDISTQHYFEDPVYTYSLRQGIDDGFLAPYKVIRVVLDRDVEGYRPEEGTIDTYGNEVPDEIYKGPDFDRKIVLDERTKLVAKKISDFLKATDRMQKTIVFCQDIDHAERMRQALVNENADKVHESARYVVRITGDSPEGKKNSIISLTRKVLIR